MDEETEVRVKKERADTHIQGQGQVDLTSVWKMHPNIECTAKQETEENFHSEILPSMASESEVRWSTFDGPQMDKRQDGMNPRSEHAVEFIRDPLRTHTPSIDIKYEEKGVESNSASNADGDHGIDPDPDSILPNMNPNAGTQCLINSEQVELSEFYHRLLQCEHDCETCQKYIRKLSDHIRATHTACQPPPDPLLIDPVAMDMDQSPATEIKCEVEEDIEGMDCPEESESDPDYNTEGGSESDPDYMTSPKTRKESDEGNSSKEALGVHKKCNIRKRIRSKIPFQCTDCDKSYTRKHSLDIHMRIHTGERPFKCPECEKTFSVKSNLTTHIRSHTGLKQFKCDLCPRAFSSKSYLTTHMRGHTGDRPFKCEECNKSYSQKSNLDYHMRSHNGEKPFKCTQCEKSFSHKTNLDYHMISHAEEKPFKCTICAKSYKQKGNLDYHLRSHTGEKPFKCAECDKSFTQKNNLYLHMRCHIGEKVWV